MANYIREALTKEEVIKIQRKAKISNGEISRLCNVDEVTVSRWKSGESSCKGKYARKLLELVPDFEFDVKKFSGSVKIEIDFNNLEIKSNGDSELIGDKTGIEGLNIVIINQNKY